MQTGVQLDHVAHRLSGAVYGTILATTVVVSTQGHEDGAGAALVIVAVTSVVFWAAHVYSLTIGRRIVLRRRLTLPELRKVARDEWPMLPSAVPVMIPLALGALGILETATAGTTAVLVGVAVLFLLGLLIGLREGLGRWGVAGSMLTTGSFGLVILALKVVVH